MACLLGAGRETWSQGLAVVLIGIALLVAPARQRLPKVGAITLMVIALIPLAALLPADWFGGISPWRQQLVSEWALPLGGAVSPQPAVTVEAWLLMVCAILWLWNCLGQGFGESQRRLAIRWLMVGGAVLAALSVLEFWQKIEIPWWPRDGRSWGVGYGPFANRNHISSLCAITCVLAAAVVYDAFRRRSKWWVAGVLSFFASLAAIFVNTSRGGLVLFFIGTALWLATSAMRRGFFKKAVVWVSILIAVGSILLVSSGSLSHRLKTGMRLDSLGGDFRVMMVGETLKMAAESPWLGVGLGNFSSVFPLVTTMHHPTLRFLHPESDVLWLLVEGGVLTLLPCVFLVGWIASISGPWRSKGEQRGRTDRRLRKAAGIGGLLALLHGFVDVPVHGVAYFMISALLLGLAVRPACLAAPAGRIDVWSFRLLGFALLGLGAGWIAVSRNLVEWPFPSSARQLHLRALAKTQARLPGEAMKLVERAIKITPLEYGLHHLRAQLRLNLGQPAASALLDFGLARAIEPNVANFCYWEGTYWLAYDPLLAAVPWREWIRRSRGGAEDLWGGYRQMVLDSEPYPDLLITLRQMAVTPAMKLIFLMAAKSGSEWQKCMDQLLAEQPTLESFDAEQLKSLFSIWLQRGDRQQLISALERNPRWLVHGWRILAEEYAGRGDFQKAYETANKQQPVRSRPANSATADINALRRAFVFNPADARPGIELFYALRAKGALDEAVYTLQKVSQLPSAPAFLKREQAAIAAEKGDFRQAWELLMAAVDSTDR
ncbi:MAG: O-antigen ligase family protein [Prosthecobacter sp.]|nr:O-antigen ligase family protein [Prosthecobacter sp.]